VTFSRSVVSSPIPARLSGVSGVYGGGSSWSESVVFAIGYGPCVVVVDRSDWVRGELLEGRS